LLCLPIEPVERTLMSSSAGHFGCSGSAFLERPLAGSSMPVVVHADQRIVIICHDPCNGNFVPACQTHRIFLRTVYVDMCAGPNIRRQPSARHAEGAEGGAIKPQTGSGASMMTCRCSRRVRQSRRRPGYWWKKLNRRSKQGWRCVRVCVFVCVCVHADVRERVNRDDVVYWYLIQ
jgi:hypothetical protein